MSDINHVWSAKHVAVSMYKMKGIDSEKAWTDERYELMSSHQKNKWPLKKIQKKLLDEFCHPDYVDSKIKEIRIERFEKAMNNGVPPVY